MRREQLLRLLLVLVVLAAGLSLLAWAWKAFVVPVAERQAGGAVAFDAPPLPALAAPPLEPGTGGQLLAAARRLLAGGEAGLLPDAAEPGARVVFLSLARPTASALVAEGRGETLADALAVAAQRLRRAAAAAGADPAARLEVDLLLELSEEARFDAEGRAELEVGFDGIWLPGPDLLLLPAELAARRLVIDGDLQNGRLRRYLEEGARGDRRLDGNPGRAGKPYRRARFATFQQGSDGRREDLYRGNRRRSDLAPDALLAAAVAGGDYLLRHQQPGGRFGYRYRPWSDAYADDYNLLRHAGSAYALFELAEATGEAAYREAGERAVEALLEESSLPRPEDAEAGFEAIVSPGREAKLGGSALAILAILQHERLTGTAPWQERSERLGRFLLFQQEASGRFESKYFYGEPDSKPFESIYYPGEAILALTRLYEARRDERWLTAARRGADWLIDVRDADKGIDELPHDHWLLIALSELNPLTDDERYRRHGEKIAQAILAAQRKSAPWPDWVGTFYTPPRSTPTATRAEALVAMHALAEATGQDPSPYRNALLSMADFQLRCQLGEVNTLFLPRPDRAAGGLRRSLENWEVRIDYVQHNLSALLGLRRILLAG